MRSWTAALGPRPAETPRHPRQPAASSNPDDPIVRGVATGGRVVDEWIRQAQQAARLMGGGVPTGDWADTGGRMFKAASDLTAMWISTLTAPLQGGAAPWTAPPTQWPFGARTGGPVAPPAEPEAARSRDDRGEPERTPRQRVRFEVASRRPVEVALDLHRNGVERFRVLDLRPHDDGAPRIQNTELTDDAPGGLKLRVTISDDQPEGTYHGVILDAAGDCAVGTLTVRISG